jgi:hypothetical protein
MHPRAASCPTAPKPASLSRWAPVLLRILRLRAPPPCRGGLRRCHVPYDFKPCLLAEVGSGAAMCSMALDTVSLSRWAPMLSRVQWLRTSPPNRGGLRRCCVSYSYGPCLPAREGPGAVTRLAVSKGPCVSYI